MLTFVIVLFVLEAMVVLQGWLAWFGMIFWPSQMLKWTRQGLPFVAHGGMVGDVLVISPFVAGVVACYGAQWSWWKIGVALTLGLVASFKMHETYKKIPWPEAHVQSGHLTEAGWVHVVYMGVAFAAILLYYFTAPYTPWMWLVSFALYIHVVVGNHLILGMFQPSWYPGRPGQNAGTWGAMLGTAVLTLGVTTLRAFHLW